MKKLINGIEYEEIFDIEKIKEGEPNKHLILNEIDLNNEQIQHYIFESCIFNRCKIKSLSLGTVNTTFNECSFKGFFLDNSVFYSTYFIKNNFNECGFYDSRFIRINFTGSTFQGCNFYKSNFENCEGIELISFQANDHPCWIINGELFVNGLNYSEKYRSNKMTLNESTRKIVDIFFK